jgi:hypothetical protein
VGADTPPEAVIQRWGRGVEAAIELAYRDCFKTYIVAGQVLTLRMPFAENNERAELADADLEVFGGGKADPASLWTRIDAMLATPDFRRFAAALGDGRDCVIMFDLAARTWSASYDLYQVARMKAGVYLGLPHKPFVLSRGVGVSAVDVYNYLYCIGRIGMDCSGFVWHVLSSVAGRAGLDLARTLGRPLRVPRGAVSSQYFGTWFFQSKYKELERVDDKIANLKPLDVLLFVGDDGQAVHSAVIQSIDYKAGALRYLQSTDEAPASDRGVHESYVYFNPARPETSLKDPTLVWSQRRFSPFTGERPSAFTDDGARYRAFPEFGGGCVVRVKPLAAAAGLKL